MRRHAAALLLLLLLAVLVAGWSRARARRPALHRTPEAAVLASIRGLEQAVEQSDIRAALELISDDFRGMRQTKSTLAGSLLLMRRQLTRVIISIDRVSIEVDAEVTRAFVVLWGSMVAQEHDGFVFEYGIAEPHRSEAVFVNEGGVWRLITMRDVPFIYGFRY